jgi:hypothetical protein
MEMAEEMAVKDGERGWEEELDIIGRENVILDDK